MKTGFTRLREAGLVKQADKVATFLAATSSPIEQSRADLVILAGNAVLACIDQAASLARQHNCLLVISGGIGHSTPALADAVAGRLDIHSQTLKSFSEAALVAKVIHKECLLPHKRILSESRSTNTGENAFFSQTELDKLKLKPHRVLLVQDPLLQKRTEATFRHVWRDRSVTFLSAPPFTPVVDHPLTSESWTEARYLSLMLGEIARLHDTTSGYGPKGKGFIGHIDISDDILDACSALSKMFVAESTR